MTPTAPNNTAVFSNPISCGSFPLTAGAITGTQLTLSSGANTSVLTTTINGLNIADPIVSTENISGTGLTVATTGNDTYTIDSRSTQGFGLTVVNSTGNNAKLSLSNGGLNVASNCRFGSIYKEIYSPVFPASYSKRGCCSIRIRISLKGINKRGLKSIICIQLRIICLDKCSGLL